MWTQVLTPSLEGPFPEIVTAHSADEARLLGREHHPALAVVQVRLPHEASLLLIDTLAAGPAPIPAVLLSLFASGLQARLARASVPWESCPSTVEFLSFARPSPWQMISHEAGGPSRRG